MSAGRLDPIAVFVEAGVNAGGADDHIRSLFQRGVLNTLENIFKDAGEFASSAGEESCGVGVAVERGAISDLECLCYVPRAFPADEFSFDGVAVRMRADAAAAGMAVEIGRFRGIGGGNVIAFFGYDELGRIVFGRGCNRLWRGLSRVPIDKLDLTGRIFRTLVFGAMGDLRGDRNFCWLIKSHFGSPFFRSSGRCARSTS